MGPLPREASGAPGETPEVPAAAAVEGAGAAPLLPNCGEGEKEAGQTRPLALQGGGSPLPPRGQLKWGGSQMSLLLPPSEGDRASVCVIRRDTHIWQQGPIKLSKAPPCKFVTYFSPD